MPWPAENEQVNMDFSAVLLHDGGMAHDAYHGTSGDRARRILESKTFEIRGEGRDELGPGVYFYLADPVAARTYAAKAPYVREQGIAVLRARVRLGNTLNTWLLKPYVEELAKRGPKQVRRLPFGRRFFLVLFACRRHFEAHGGLDSMRHFRKYVPTNRNVLVLVARDPSQVLDVVSYKKYRKGEGGSQ